MSTPEPPRREGLRVGYVPGVTVIKWRTIWRERFRKVLLETKEITEAEQLRCLLDGEVDMCFVRLPIDRCELHTIPLYDEAPVVWMHKDFLLAALDEVKFSDLAEFRIVDAYDAHSIDLAVYGAAALRVPLSVARTQSRRDMVHRPVLDAEPTTIALAWRRGNDNPWIDEFVGVVRGRTANSSRTVKERAAGKPATPDSQRLKAGERSSRRTRRPRRRHR